MRIAFDISTAADVSIAKGMKAMAAMMEMLPLAEREKREARRVVAGLVFIVSRPSEYGGGRLGFENINTSAP